jgi:prepilin-type N-terminal cleavage/methylation domain-containing protein
MIRQTVRRPGVTLIEVLIATFILSIGMLAIMALFPIGAVSMARAINQTRAADHGANSDATFRIYWKGAWTDQNGGGVRSSSNEAYAASGFTEDMIPLLDRRRAANGTINPTVSDIPPNSSQPSNPILVDPIGWRTQAGVSQVYVAGQTPPAAPTGPPPLLPFMPARTSLSVCAADASPRTTVRLTTLLDDMTFDRGGEPASYATGQLERGGRYNTAWLIQRPRNNVPQEVRVRVLVFAGRSPTDTPSSETLYPASASGYVNGVDPKPNSVSMYLNGQAKPNIRKGSWVAFSTTANPPGGTPYSIFDFYRISGINDDNPNVLVVEFEEPLRTYETGTLPQPAAYEPGPTRLNGYIVVFDNLYEVFDRGVVSMSSISGR